MIQQKKPPPEKSGGGGGGVGVGVGGGDDGYSRYFSLEYFMYGSQLSVQMLESFALLLKRLCYLKFFARFLMQKATHN